MRVLVIGASGLIGLPVTARLLQRGDDVVAVARRIAGPARQLPRANWLKADIARMTTPGQWLDWLRGVDAVVSCAGVLQDGGGDDVAGVHREGVVALCKACVEADVRRVVHLSAIGIDREAPTAFSRTKRDAEEDLARLDLDWVVLRPSVVVGRQAYGGSAMFRALAALPWLPELPVAGRLQIVQLDDVVETILGMLDPTAPSRLALDLPGPEPLTMTEVVRHYRRWLGLPPQRVVALPSAVASLAYRLGDIVGWLGWRTPLRSTAERELRRGATGDPAAWSRVLGRPPLRLSDALAAEPAGVQEKWFAAMLTLKPLVFGVFAAFWIGTALISLGPGFWIGRDLMLAGGAGPLAGPSVVAGALADLLIGIGIAVRRTSRAALWAALAISLFYAIAGTSILPRLWADPLGPMLKIWPIVVLNLVALAILRDR